MIYVKRNPSEGKISERIVKKSTSKEETHNISRVNESSVDHKKKISSLSTFNSMGSMRNSISVIGAKKDFHSKFSSKIRENSLSINVLSLSQNKDNIKLNHNDYDIIYDLLKEDMSDITKKSLIKEFDSVLSLDLLKAEEKKTACKNG